LWWSIATIDIFVLNQLEINWFNSKTSANSYE